MGEWNLDWMLQLTSASPTALHCGFSGTMTPWNVLSSSAADPFLVTNPALTRAILTEMKMVRLASCDEVTSLATRVRCLSVESSFPLAPYSLHAC